MGKKEAVNQKVYYYILFSYSIAPFLPLFCLLFFYRIFPKKFVFILVPFHLD